MGTVLLRVIVSSILLGRFASAQNSFDEALARREAIAPSGFSLRLERISGDVLNEGELVLIRVQHKAPYEQRFGLPLPPLRYQFAGFLIDPPLQECGTLMKPCFYVDDLAPEWSDNLLRLDVHQQLTETDLNSYLPPLGVGSYRVATVMRKLVLRNRPSGEVVFEETDPPEYLVSDSISFEVRPASDEWIRNTLAAARRIFFDNRGLYESDIDSEKRAARQVASIARSEAHLAALELFGLSGGTGVWGQIIRGLFRHMTPRDACALLRSRLNVPEQKIHLNYSSVMGTLCAEIELPLPDELKTVAESDPRRVEWTAKRNQHEVEVEREVMAIVAARAERGGTDARELSLQVLNYGSSLLLTETGQIEDVPEFAIRTARRVARELASYKVPDIVTALSPSHWPLLRVVNPEAALRSIIGKLIAPPGAETTGKDAPTWVFARQQAIRRFHEINPSGARLVLIDELQHFRPTMDLSMTQLLPVEAVPPMDDALLQKLAEWHQSGAQPRTQIPILIAKYLSPRGAEYVKQVFEELKNSSCQSELMAYFVRVEPAYAESILRNFQWNISHSMNQCGLLYQSDPPGFGFHVILEDYMITNLKHEAFGVKSGAAFHLRGRGSARALQPLEDAFRSFHEYWDERKQQLEDASNRGAVEARQLETIFRSAIAWGRGWLVDDAALRKLADLCITNVCKNAALADAARWEQKPIRVEIAPPDSGYGFQGSVLQYRGLQGVEGVKEKLAQFPKGTEFELHVRAAPWDRETIADEIRQFASEAGLILK